MALSGHFTLNTLHVKLIIFSSKPCPPSSVRYEWYHNPLNLLNQNLGIRGSPTTHPFPSSPSPNPSNNHSVSLPHQQLLKPSTSLHAHDPGPSHCHFLPQMVTNATLLFSQFLKSSSKSFSSLKPGRSLCHAALNLFLPAYHLSHFLIQWPHQVTPWLS